MKISLFSHCMIIKYKQAARQILIFIYINKNIIRYMGCALMQEMIFNSNITYKIYQNI